MNILCLVLWQIFAKGYICLHICDKGINNEDPAGHAAGVELERGQWQMLELGVEYWLQMQLAIFLYTLCLKAENESINRVRTFNSCIYTFHCCDLTVHAWI